METTCTTAKTFANTAEVLPLLLLLFIWFSRYISLFRQVNIDVEDINDNPPEFESATVRISVPENVDLGTPLYAANAHDRDSGKSGIVRYRLTNVGGGSNSASASTQVGLFNIDSHSGHLTLSRHLDYETAQRHTLIVTATDGGEPSLSANLTILVEVQDVNDNPPVFERNEYSVNVIESMPVNSQVRKQKLYYLFFKLIIRFFLLI